LSGQYALRVLDNTATGIGKQNITINIIINRYINSAMRSFVNCTLHKSRMMRWVGHGARMGEMKNAYKILVGKPERKKH
jgi:hypothetical protein